MRTVTLSLISHTNVGKTTLARTLLRRDVGEVLDQAHVTEVSEAHELVASGDARLLLWDTPGLGDSARLVSRLRGESNPLGWLLHQVWDRTRERPLYSSQEAVRNIKDDADVVLYLVNASESPEDAGYVPCELELLTWIGKPVIVLLNQVGDGASGAPDPIVAWQVAMRGWPIVGHVLPLDAFTRCWVQEGVLLDHVATVLPEAERATMRELTAVWEERNLTVFAESVARMGRYLAAAAVDRERLRPDSPSRADKRRAMRALAIRLDEATRDLVEGLLDLHGLRGRHQEDARTRLEEDFRMPGEVAWTSGGAAIFGAAMGGAAGGLAADVMVGGLSFGAGAIAGAILGAASAAGLVKGYQLALSLDAPVVRWSREHLHDLVRQTVLRYLAIAHFGRGRGEWRELGNAARWTGLGVRAIAAREEELDACIAIARDDFGGTDAPAPLSALVRRALREILITSYPQATQLLSR